MTFVQMERYTSDFIGRLALDTIIKQALKACAQFSTLPKSVAALRQDGHARFRPGIRHFCAACV